MCIRITYEGSLIYLNKYAKLKIIIKRCNVVVNSLIFSSAHISFTNLYKLTYAEVSLTSKEK
jgi:hypothetical protein